MKLPHLLARVRNPIFIKNQNFGNILSKMRKKDLYPIF